MALVNTPKLLSECDRKKHHSMVNINKSHAFQGLDWHKDTLCFCLSSYLSAWSQFTGRSALSNVLILKQWSIFLMELTLWYKCTQYVNSKDNSSCLITKRLCNTEKVGAKDTCTVETIFSVISKEIMGIMDQNSLHYAFLIVVALRSLSNTWYTEMAK